ncbi:MAG: cytochrome c biogenesis protein ResB [Deltaproteobacteria bacterium]|nr:cytochrome c biogenesis protein ResB [Deltaproteobacteria bacterium]
MSNDTGQNAEKKSLVSNIPLTVWSIFSSLKFTIFILMAIAFVSIFGTIVEQGREMSVYVAEYGEKWARVIEVLRLDDMYHTGWFTSLLILLVLNIIACTWERFPSKWKSLLGHADDFNTAVIKNLSHKESVRVYRSSRAAVELTTAMFAKHKYKHRVRENSDGSVAVYAWKGLIGRFGSDVTHVSLFVILLGAIIGSYWGYKDFKSMTVGTTATVKNADFSLRLDKFWIDYYESGQIRQYNSILTVIEGGKEVFQKQIWVNEPLYYKGIRFYQSSWGKSWNRIQAANLVLKRIDSGAEVTTFSVPWGEMVNVPGTPYSVKIAGFVSDFAFDPETKQIYSSGDDHKNPALMLEVYEKDKERNTAWIFGNIPGFRQAIPGTKYDLLLDSYNPALYSGLSVNKDPGTNIVWLGTGIMGVGFFFAFFIFHRRVWVQVSPDGNAMSVVDIGGMTNKNTLGFEKEFAEMVKSLKDIPMGGTEAK